MFVCDACSQGMDNLKVYTPLAHDMENTKKCITDLNFSTHPACEITHCGGSEVKYSCPEIKHQHKTEYMY